MRVTRTVAAALDGLASASDLAGLRLRFELVTWVPLVGSTLPRPQVLLLRKRGPVLRAELHSGDWRPRTPTPALTPTTVLVLSAGGSERAPRGCWVLDAGTKSARMATSAAWAMLDSSIGVSNRRRLEVAHQVVAPVIPVITRNTSDAMAWTQRRTSSLMDKAGSVLTSESPSKSHTRTVTDPSNPDLQVTASAPETVAVDAAARSQRVLLPTTEMMVMQLLPYQTAGLSLGNPRVFLECSIDQIYGGGKPRVSLRGRC